MAEVKATFVDAFPTSPTRPQIFAALERLCADLDRNGVRCEIWVDGSFISEKPDPEDADISVVVDQDVFYALDSSLQAALDAMLNDKNYDPLLHNFIEIRYPRDHPNYPIWAEAERGWMEWWSVGEKSTFLRGVPIVRLGESDVGHHLLRK